jgi:hypothetical protein
VYESGVLANLLLVIYWFALVATMAASVALSVLAWRTPKPAFVYAATGTLAASLLLAAVPTSGTGFALQALVAILSIAIAVAGGGPAAALALRLASRGIAEGEHGGIIQNGGEVLRGGTAVGLLERVAIAGVILAGFPEGIAVIVAIKGVGRFTELDAAPTRERFIIGTFVSLIWAAAAIGIALMARD